MIRLSSALLIATTMLSFLIAAPARSQTDSSAGYATRSFTPQNFHMPDGAGCTGDVARWQAIQDNDYKTGNIGLSTYHHIQSEIGQAAQACSTGHDAQASALIRASRARHGYPQ